MAGRDPHYESGCQYGFGGQTNEVVCGYDKRACHVQLEELYVLARDHPGNTSLLSSGMYGRPTQRGRRPEEESLLRSRRLLLALLLPKLVSTTVF